MIAAIAFVIGLMVLATAIILWYAIKIVDRINGRVEELERRLNMHAKVNMARMNAMEANAAPNTS